MRSLVCLIVLVFLFVLSSFSLSQHDKTDIGARYAIGHFRKGAIEYAESIQVLASSIQKLSDSSSIAAAKFQLAQCRLSYKKIEYFIEYFFENRIKIFNLPPVYEIEEPYMEYQSPLGMQVIEAYLFDENPKEHKDALLTETEVLYTTAISLPDMLADKKIGDEEILESLRLELIRLMSLGITGYDAPELKSGISEAYASVSSMRDVLQQYWQVKHADSLTYYINTALGKLSEEPDFNKFDRLDFISESFLPLQEYLGKLIKDLGLEINTTGTLNYNAKNIFQKDALDVSAFSADTFDLNPALVALGKELFFEKRLSGNGKRSCANCHVPGKYFTDALPKSLAFDEQTHISRNAPSLLYAAYQHGQFLDARAKNLSEQVHMVLASKDEMNANFRAIVKVLSSDRKYKLKFKTAFPALRKKEAVTIDNIAKAIAAYERSFPLMSSAFDKYMSGDKNALTASEQKGFNLFMGKALCGTCHFAPVFNALLPPYYNITELESLGVTADSNLIKPIADIDSGRYKVFPIEFYIGAFKTPTVRNSGKTAPYMHNGAFNDLKQLMNFYNKGGGNGLGFNNPYQTLSSKQLHLSEEEMGNVIHFLEALTDEAPVI